MTEVWRSESVSTKLRGKNYKWISFWKLIIQILQPVLPCNDNISRLSWLDIAKHGCQICPKSGSDLHQIGQIQDFLRFISVHFGSESQNVLKWILKSLGFILFDPYLTRFRSISDTRIAKYLYAGRYVVKDVDDYGYGQKTYF